MNKEVIERCNEINYIRFAIKNKLKLDWEIIKEVKLFYQDTLYTLYTGYDDFIEIWLHELITSQGFIQAVARWLEKSNLDFMIIWKYNYSPKVDWQKYWCYIDKITTQQAIAIRDNSLDKFINNLIPNEN